MKKLGKILICALFALALTVGGCLIPAYAASDADVTDDGANGAQEYSDSEENPFEMLWSGVLNNSEKIMCALTLAGSVVLTFLYKKGLLPFLSRGLSAIAAALSGIKESTDQYAQKSGKDFSDISEALGRSESAIGGISERLSALERTLDEAGSAREQTEAIRAVMSAQVELLYDILMNSAIPQYRKDAAGERLTEMKAALATKSTEA